MATFAEDEAVLEPTGISSRPTVQVVAVCEETYRTSVDLGSEPYHQNDWDCGESVSRVLEQSQLVAAVSAVPEDHDLTVDIRVTRSIHNQISLWAIATAFLIPGVQDRTLCVRTALRTRTGGHEASSEACRDFRVWFELLFLPIWAWHTPAGFEERLRDTLIQNTARTALRELPGWAAAQQGAAADATLVGRS
jgi:hypothetical protein